MYILQPVATEQTITIVSRDDVFSSEDLDLYFERVLLDGGTLESTACVRQALNDLDGVTLYLRNESTRTTATINPTITESNGYMSLSAIFSVSEGVFYNIKVVKGSTDIYRGLAFCTTQTDYDKYSVNDGAYVTEPADNEFVIL